MALQSSHHEKQDAVNLCTVTAVNRACYGDHSAISADIKSMHGTPRMAGQLCLIKEIICLAINYIFILF